MKEKLPKKLDKSKRKIKKKESRKIKKKKE